MEILIPMLLLGVLLYVMLIRPQRAMKRRRDELNAALSEGDEIVTIGGIYGRVADVRDDTVDVEISEGIIVRIDRRAVAGITKDLPAGAAHQPVDEDADVREPAVSEREPAVSESEPAVSESEPASVASDETR
jgi:preprotein translocase subunit YajC